MISKYIDPRHIQIFNNTFMAYYGYLYLNFHRKFTYLIPAFVVALLLDYLLSEFTKSGRSKRGLYDRAVSITNSIASIYVIVNVDSALFYFLAIVFATLSKFCFSVNGHHVFNPGNVGIVLSLLFISDSSVRIIYTQFASPSMFLFWFVMFNGFLIVFWAKRFTVAAAYLLGSCAFLYALSPLFGFNSTILIGPTFSTAGILFAFFMITDPRTTPSSVRGQIAFGLVCALFGALLRMNQMVHDAFVGLFLTTALYSIIRFKKVSVPAVAARSPDLSH